MFEAYFQPMGKEKKASGMQATFFVIDVHIPFVHTAFVEALMPTSDYKRG